MNNQAQVAAASAASKFNLARVGRLARKELRETLRDRRTIITLVLMPLLVYPVLSFALKQFLVTSTSQARPIPLQICTSTQEDLVAFMILLERGDRLLHEQESNASNSPLAGGPVLGAALGTNELPLAENQIGVLHPEIAASLEDAVRNSIIDVGVRRLPIENLENAREELRFQLIYRPNTPLSRQAADFVERRLRAVNEHDLRKRLEKAGDHSPLRAGWRLLPVADEKGHSFWLGALLPLVLILMTITGAVYPAIDLTAGERERGTLESLMAAPVPRLSVLIAKYLAVVTVATLTAVINLTAMMVTLATAGRELWTIFFGNQGSPLSSIVAVLLLLVLFAMFFSAVLLLVTSFARSFKEAQAYVVPLMVVAMAPGFMSVMPGLRLGPLMSVVPLSNIVLLARDVMEGNASILWGAVAVFTTLIYGGVALALAARVFGSDAILYGSEGTWADLFQRPKELKSQATVTDALSSLAVVTPIFILASGMLATLKSVGMETQLMAAAGTTLIVFIIVPLLLARFQGADVGPGFQLSRPKPQFIAAAAVLGTTLWPLAYNSIILCQHLGLATLSSETLAEHREAFSALIEKLRAVPPWILIPCLAVMPGIAEEFFFRGYLLGSLRGKLPAWFAIGLTGLIFGLFHASLGGIILVERVLSSTFLGIILGWVCWQTGSVFPGMVLHVLNNALMLSLVYLGPQLQDWDRNTENEKFLPLTFVLVTTAIAGATALGLALFTRRHHLAQTAPA